MKRVAAAMMCLIRSWSIFAVVRADRGAARSAPTVTDSTRKGLLIPVSIKYLLLITACFNLVADTIIDMNCKDNIFLVTHCCFKYRIICSLDYLKLKWEVL